MKCDLNYVKCPPTDCSRIYVGARYVPTIEGKWDINKEYEPLSIVVDENNNSFTSKKYVPIGILLNDINFWVMTGNYNAQIEEIVKRLDELDARIKAIENATRG